MTSRRLEGKSAVVIGASRGIGSAAALGLAREGARVVVAAKSTRSRESLPGSIHSVVQEIQDHGGAALPCMLDVRKDDHVDALAQLVEEDFDGLDILIYNAGALWWQNLLDTPRKRFDLLMGVNLRGAYAVCHALAPKMNPGGHIVLYSPPLNLEALPGRTCYLVSKFGMTMMAQGLSGELAPHIAVNTLWPVTAVKSQATINYGIGSPKTWRTPEIMVDATLEIVTTPPAELTGRALLDEDFLRERGWKDFVKYRCDPDHEPPRFDIDQLPQRGAAPKSES